MQPEQTIRDKFDMLYRRVLQKRQNAYLTMGYRNCKFNSVKRVRKNGWVGFCVNPEVVTRRQRFLFVCNDDETAEKCECYECKHTEDSVRAEFHEELRNPALCGQKHPKLAILLWCLQEMPEDRSRRRRFIRALLSSIREVWSLIRCRWW